METKIITLLSIKGGVGKTSSSFNIAYSLSKLGKKVLLCDLDCQSSLTLIAGEDPSSSSFNLTTINDLLMSLMEGKEVNKIKLKEINDNLFLLSSTPHLVIAKKNMEIQSAKEFMLQRIIKRYFENKYDYIIMDCSPAMDTININALVCSDYLIIPCETDPMATFSLPDIYRIVSDITNNPMLNPDLKILGILATKFNKVKKQHKEELEWIQSKKKNGGLECIGVIKNSAEMTKGIGKGKCVCELNPKCDVAKEYSKVANYIISKCNNN